MMNGVIRIYFLVFFCSTVLFAEIPEIFKGYESSEKVVIVIPDKSDTTYRVMAESLASKFSKVYPEDYVKVESYVDRFKLNYYANYAVIMIGQIDDLSVMRNYNFFPWRKLGDNFFSVDYGLVEGDFSFIYTGDNPFSIAKDLLAKKSQETASTPFVYLGGSSVEMTAKSIELFFESKVTSGLFPQSSDSQFSRLKANSLTAQKPSETQLPNFIKVPQELRYVGLKQGTLRDYSFVYEITKSLPKKISQMKYLPLDIESYSKKRSIFSEENTVKVVEFAFEQQAISAYKKLKLGRDYQAYRKSNKVFLYRFTP